MKKMMMAGAFGVAALAAFLPDSANAQLTLAPIQLGRPLVLECANPGGSQDVAKQPTIKNTASAALKAGTTISWTSTDGDKGSFKLSADLAPGATVKAMGAPGSAYTCGASASPRADLVVKSALWSGNSSVNVQVTNDDTFMDAAGSVVRLEVMSCSGTVLHKLDSLPVAVPKGETRMVNFPVWLPSGKTYLRVTVDANKQVSERNEGNNIYDGASSCLR